MNAKCRCWLTMALVLTLVDAAVGLAQTTLRYQFKAGDRLHYALEQKSKLTFSVMEFRPETLMEQSWTMTWHVQSVDADGAAKLRITFGRCKKTVKTPDSLIAVDSADAKPPDDVLGKLLHKVARTWAVIEVGATVSTRGEFTDIKVADQHAKEFQSIPEGEQFVDGFSPAGLQRMFNQSGLVLPATAVTEGTTWKNRHEAKMSLGKMIVDVECAYRGAVAKEGRMLERIELKPRNTLEPRPKAAVTVTLKSQEGAGLAWFDNASGRLLEVVHQATTDLEREQMGAVLPIRSVQTTSLRLVESR